MCGSSRHVGRMYVGVRLHLVHAGVARWRVAGAILSTVRGTLMGLVMQWLTGATQRMWLLLGRRCLEPSRLAV